MVIINIEILSAKSEKQFVIWVIRLNFEKTKIFLRLVLWQMWANQSGKLGVGFSKKSKFEGENVDGN